MKTEGHPKKSRLQNSQIQTSFHLHQSLGFQSLPQRKSLPFWGGAASCLKKVANSLAFGIHSWNKKIKLKTNISWWDFLLTSWCRVDALVAQTASCCRLWFSSKSVVWFLWLQLKSRACFLSWHSRWMGAIGHSQALSSTNFKDFFSRIFLLKILMQESAHPFCHWSGQVGSQTEDGKKGRKEGSVSAYHLHLWLLCEASAEAMAGTTTPQNPAAYRLISSPTLLIQLKKTTSQENKTVIFPWIFQIPENQETKRSINSEPNMWGRRTSRIYNTKQSFLVVCSKPFLKKKKKLFPWNSIKTNVLPLE